MAKQLAHDQLLTKPIPSAKVPWFIILCLLAGLVLIYMGFLRSTDQLLGPRIKPNEYERYLHARPHPVTQVRPAQPAAPATPPTQLSSPSGDASIRQ